MKQIIVTAAVIINAGKILLAQRPTNSNWGGKWEFPGGKLEFGEEPRKGLERELFEELGINSRATSILEVVTEITTEKQLILLYFLCQIISGEPAPLASPQLGWFEPNQVDLLSKPPADEEFWQKYSLTIKEELKL